MAAPFSSDSSATSLSSFSQAPSFSFSSPFSMSSASSSTGLFQSSSTIAAAANPNPFVTFGSAVTSASHSTPFGSSSSSTSFTFSSSPSLFTSAAKPSSSINTSSNILSGSSVVKSVFWLPSSSSSFTTAPSLQTSPLFGATSSTSSAPSASLFRATTASSGSVALSSTATTPFPSFSSIPSITTTGPLFPSSTSSFLFGSPLSTSSPSSAATSLHTVSSSELPSTATIEIPTSLSGGIASTSSLSSINLQSTSTISATSLASTTFPCQSQSTLSFVLENDGALTNYLDEVPNSEQAKNANDSTIAEPHTTKDITYAFSSSDVDIAPSENEVSSFDPPSLIISLEPKETYEESEVGLEILHLFCQSLVNKKLPSAQRFTTRANAMLNVAWVEGVQLDRYIALFKDIERSLFQLENVPSARTAHDASVAMEETAILSLRNDLAKMRNAITALTEKADELAAEIVHREGLLPSAFVDPSSSIVDHIHSRLREM